MKALFRHLYYDFFYYTGISRLLIKWKLMNSSIILTYHNILSKELMSPYYVNYVDVAEDNFVKHIQWLKHIQEIQPVKDINKRKGIFVSFDDGMKNNYNTALGILKEQNVTAMFAVCTALTSLQRRFLWRDELFLIFKRIIGEKINYAKCSELNGITVTGKNINYIANIFTNFIQNQGLMIEVYKELDDLKRLNGIEDIVLTEDELLRFKPMNTEELKKLLQLGHSIVSHTHSHYKLSYLSTQDIKIELTKSKEIITEMVGESDVLVYPYGNQEAVDHRSYDCAKEAGFTFAYMNEYKRESKALSISRRNMTNVTRKTIFYGVLAGLNI